ncbi:hypothetical protein [Agrobacterium rosae]|uniref:hypothetical protein n=1 Tax=Agrobacterium rosae TaxID=1972867 RepID=UPI003BA1F4D5
MSDLQYRPNHYYDWGMIRNADGSMHATVRRPEAHHGEFDIHREQGTDPFAELASKIIFYEDLVAENASLKAKISQEAPNLADITVATITGNMSDELRALLGEASATYDVMKPEERERMWNAQRASFVQGMTTPCEHGKLDFEQCVECRRGGGA